MRATLVSHQWHPLISKAQRVSKGSCCLEFGTFNFESEQPPPFVHTADWFCSPEAEEVQQDRTWSMKQQSQQPTANHQPAGSKVGDSWEALYFLICDAESFITILFKHKGDQPFLILTSIWTVAQGPGGEQLTALHICGTQPYRWSLEKCSL
jgi:hypothetical protein